jgi:cyclic pyranopterin phosphate synthase
MPDENMQFWPQEKLMQAAEIEAIAKVFVGLGVRKIRLTGGEPLVRKDAATIIRAMGALPVELTLTTNGVLLDQYLDTLLSAGVRSLNISLDTLDREKFAVLTRRDQFQQVWDNIHRCLEAGLHTKINVVLMRGVNDVEINDFVALTEHLPLHIRFIEFMPFVSNAWNEQKVVSYAEVLERVSSKYSIEKLHDEFNDTAKKYQIPGFKGTFAVISTVTDLFCAGCNRMRLTADGKMKNCLFSKTETDLLTPFRQQEDIAPLIYQSVWDKRPTRGVFDDQVMLTDRSMILIGG